jgi:hypothetical protein
MKCCVRFLLGSIPGKINMEWRCKPGRGRRAKQGCGVKQCPVEQMLGSVPHGNPGEYGVGDTSHCPSTGERHWST